MTLGVLLGETVVRLFNMTIDVPRMYMGSDHLIKFEPNQTGNYVNGEHQWVINKYGNFGYEPPALKSLVTVIGDSFISNMMNPPECHQANFLAQLNPDYNFYPTSRDGASFIEYMEMKRSLQHLKRVTNLLYVHHSDFLESIADLQRKPLTVQVALEKDSVIYARLSSNPLKNALRNFKLGYYMYRNFLIRANTSSISTNNSYKDKKSINYNAISALLDYVKTHYRIDDIILVFSPTTDQKVIELTKRKGFKTLALKAKDYSTWKLKHDSHWSCTGHQKAAIQVNNHLNSTNFAKPQTVASK